MFAARAVIVPVLCLLASLAPAAPNDINVSVDKYNDQLFVRGSMRVDASPAEVWQVLVDYDNAQRFHSDLEESRVLERRGDTWRVLQRARFQFGPLTIPIESVREVKLFKPQRIVSRILSGTPEKADAVTEIASDGAGTRLTYRSDITSSNFIPISLLKSEAERHFAQLRDEVMRRRPHGATR